MAQKTYIDGWRAGLLAGGLLMAVFIVTMIACLTFVTKAEPRPRFKVPLKAAHVTSPYQSETDTLAIMEEMRSYFAAYRIQIQWREFITIPDWCKDSRNISQDKEVYCWRQKFWDTVGSWHVFSPPIEHQGDRYVGGVSALCGFKTVNYSNVDKSKSRKSSIAAIHEEGHRFGARHDNTRAALRKWWRHLRAGFKRRIKRNMMHPDVNGLYPTGPLPPLTLQSKREMFSCMRRYFGKGS